VRLLIVDDSPEIRTALSRIAEQQHHLVVGEAENGKEALRLVPEVQPDMVLLDVSMPVMGGFATARKLKQIAPELPIVFISQHADRRLRIGSLPCRCRRLSPEISDLLRAQPGY